MTTLDIARELHLNPVRVSSHNGGEYASACPMCGGNDRFRVWPEKGEYGAFWCRGCGKGGDAISLLIEAKRMSFKEAAAAVGKRLEARKAPRTPREPKRQADWIPREISAPAELWQARAAAFADFCHRELLQNTQQLAWLEGRGITAETARHFRLGWNPKALFRKRPTWGLEIKKEVIDGVEKLKEWFCLPQGLVIPWFVDGNIHRLRIRKPEGEPRYLVVPGSGMAPMMISAAEFSSCRRGKAWVVVESELDAVLIAQEAGDIAGAAALGSVATKPDGALYGELKAADSILVALDADEAGKKGWPWWQEHFPQADRWIVPRGKDPGDFRKEGGDIRAWVVAGLPPGLRPVAKKAESAPSKVQQAEIETPAMEPEPLPAAPIPTAPAKHTDAPGAHERRAAWRRLQSSFYSAIALRFPVYDESGWDKRDWLRQAHPGLYKEVEALFSSIERLVIDGPDRDFRQAVRAWQSSYSRAYALAAAYLRNRRPEHGHP